MKNTKQLGVAIVGCGLIGRKRANCLTEDAQLRTVCDINLARAQELARAFPGCQAVEDYRVVVADERIDIIIIATLNASLAPISLAAINANKHVLVEKPGALNSAQLLEVQSAAQKAGVRVRIGYNHRFHPAVLKAKAMIDEGGIGPLMFLRARYGHGGRKGYDREWRADASLSGGGELIDQGVHLIDLASWFLGRFTQIDGHAATHYWDMKVDDNAFLSLRTKQGQTAWLHVSCTEWKNVFSMEIYGHDGKISIDGLGGSYGVERLTYYKMLPEMGPPETTIFEYPRGDNSWALETQAFIDDILLNREPLPGLPEGIRIMEIVDSIYQKSGFSISK